MTPKRIEEMVYEICGDNSLIRQGVRKALRRAVVETLEGIRPHVEFDDGEGNNDPSVLRGRLAAVLDIINSCSR